MGDVDRLRNAFEALTDEVFYSSTEPLISRDVWIARFVRISIQSMMLNTPGVECDILDMHLTIVRIGSFWFRDEECHVYVMEQALKIMFENHDRISGDFAVISPLWAFYRVGNGARIVKNPEAMAVAGRNFLKFFNEAYARHKKNG